MKVIVKGNSVDDMQVTFFITNKEEKASFHDHCAITLCNGGNEFIGKIYDPKHYIKEEFNIPIKPPIKF